jgi:hypothetical protein
VIASCRRGSGPASDGIDAPRYNNFIQMAFYNGWKYHHGTKRQSVESVYPVDTHLLSRVFDGMASIRIANERNGITANLFPFIKRRAAQKSMSCQDISYYYFVATILRNINVILYGSVTSSSSFETGD